MNYSYPQQTFQDVPDEIALALSISGCPLRCKGCHSTETYDPNFGEKLTIEVLTTLISKFKHTSCILFYGGEWDLIELTKMILYVKTLNLKVCLYTGHNLSFFTDDFIHLLDYIKVGKFIKSKGNLTNPKTNQRFYEITNDILINKTFRFQS